MPFTSWDPIVRAVFFGGVFLLPLVAVLWLWYDSSGRTGSARWFWRLILTIAVLLTTPAVALGAANTDDDKLVSVFGWVAIASAGIAILGVLAYAIWGRSPMAESQDYPLADMGGYPQPYQMDPMAMGGPETMTIAAPAPTLVAPAAPTLVAPAAPAAPVAPKEPIGAYLFVKTGANQGHQFPVGNQVTIGRGAGCGITLDDSRVSSEHGQLKRQGDSYVYLDLKSTNGSFLVVEGREERLRSGQALVDGDELRLGGTVLKFIRVPEGGRR
jgi:hypothetical protein